MRYYTMGEVARLGLLKGVNGAVKDVAGVRRVLSKRLKLTTMQTRHGVGYAVTAQQLKEVNKARGY